MDEVRHLVWVTALCFLFKKRVFIQHYLYYAGSKCSDMDHTVLPANYTMPAFPSLALPGGATPNLR